MNKKEIIWREILIKFAENKKIDFTQKALSQKFGISMSTVFNALKIPRAIGAVEVRGRGFSLINFEKLLYLWATARNINKDTIYATHLSQTVREIEGNLPPQVVFGAYTAFKQKYKEVPADYDKVYVYAENDKEIKKRFPYQKGYFNLIVLQADKFLKDYGLVTADPQTFVDLWNLQDWYAHDFLKDLRRKMIK